MASSVEELELDFDVDAPVSQLQAWWTELPEVYEAEDTREQPHRIELLEETDDGGVYETTWRGPLGVEFSLIEHLHVDGPGSWRFVIPGYGFTIQDRFEASDEGEGCHLRIRSTITYDRTLGKLVRRALIPRWRKRFTETFANAVDVFEDRQSRRSPTPASG